LSKLFWDSIFLKVAVFYVEDYDNIVVIWGWI